MESWTAYTEETVNWIVQVYITTTDALFEAVLKVYLYDWIPKQVTKAKTSFQCLHNTLCILEKIENGY